MWSCLGPWMLFDGGVGPDTSVATRLLLFARLMQLSVEERLAAKRRVDVALQERSLQVRNDCWVKSTAILKLILGSVQSGPLLQK